MPKRTSPVATTDPQDLHRSVFEGDNLHVLRGMDSGSVDLIYLDPPFNSNKEYSAPIGSKAAGAAFKDAWTLSDVDLLEHNRLKLENETLYALIYAAGKAHSKGMFSYLMMMAPRLVEMRRVLRRTGSIYIHCDPAANAYLRMLCDAVFGPRRFRSEIVWRRTNAHSKTSTQYGPIHDTVLFYAMSGDSVFHPGTRPYSKAYIEDRFKQTDDRGRYQANYLTGPGVRAGESGDEWGGFDPTAAGRHWAIPRSLRAFLPNDGQGMGSHAKLDCLNKQGFIVFPQKSGGQPMYKQYIGPGVPYQDLWAYQPNTSGTLFDFDEHIDQDVKWLETERERTGFPTQKPLGVLDRILRTSSNEGDLVLDPFCGCATTMVSAELLDRKWCGIDLSSKAAELVVGRIQQNRSLFRFQDIKHRNTIPIRTDIKRGMASTAKERKVLKAKLYNHQGGCCNLCHTWFDSDRHFEMDHIFPRSKGGQDWVDNFQLLCGSCNKIKSNKTQEEARARLVEIRGIDFTPFDNGPTVIPLPRAAEKTATYRGQKVHVD